jgi:hypothetical protein
LYNIAIYKGVELIVFTSYRRFVKVIILEKVVIVGRVIIVKEVVVIGKVVEYRVVNVLRRI